MAKKHRKREQTPKEYGRKPKKKDKDKRKNKNWEFDDALFEEMMQEYKESKEDAEDAR